MDNTNAVEMIDTKGRRHMVKQFEDRQGNLNWCAARWIKTTQKFSGNYNQVDITGWAKA